MSYFKIIGFTLTALVAIILFRRLKDEYALFLSLLVGISLTVTAFSVIKPFFEYVKSFGNIPYVSLYTGITVKACGIAIITTVACDLCRDSGEASLANRLEFCGKALILSLALPLIKNVFDSCVKLLG